MRSREWLIENSKTHIEVDLFLRAGGDLITMGERYGGDNTVTLTSGHKGKGIGIEESEFKVVHKFRMEIPDVAIRAICRRPSQSEK